MLARVNLPRRKRDSKPAFGTYVLTYTDGTEQTVRSDVLQLADYPDVNKAIALNGGTIVAANRTGQTLGGTAGDYGLSLVGGGTQQEYFSIGGGQISISNYNYYTYENPDVLQFGDGLPGDYTIGADAVSIDVVAVPPGVSKGTLILCGKTENDYVYFTSAYSWSRTQINSAPEPGLFSKSPASVATHVYLTSRTGDYGVIGTNASVDNQAQGAEYYGSIQDINAYYSDSTVHGNARNNNLNLMGGGDRQIVIGGMGNDSIFINAGSAMMLDYGIGVTHSGINKSLANNTAQTLTTPMYAYDRFDIGSYCPGSKTIRIRGTVTGIYFLYHANAVKSKKQNSFTAAITYTHNNGSDEVIVLRDVMKTPETTSSTDSKKVFWTNAVAAAKIHPCQIDSNGNSTQLTADDVKPMFHEDTAIPLWAARKVAGLNEAYNSLDPPHYNSRVTERSAAYNVANAPFNTITPATVDDWWYANYADDSGTVDEEDEDEETVDNNDI